MNTITGNIVTIGKTVNVSKKNEFLKRDLVLDCSRYDEFTGKKRENYVSMSFTQKRCEDLNGYQVGELVEVSFILNGRKYEKDGQTRYITDIIGYKVERKGKGAPQAAPSAPQEPSAPQAQSPSVQPSISNEQTDLPF